MKKINQQIEDYLKYCKENRQMSEVTLKTKRYILERFARETKIKNLNQLSNQILNIYTAKMIENGISGSSINTYNATILVFVKYHQALGAKIPFKTTLVRKQKELKTERKFYTKTEIAKVLKIADFETGLIIRIMFETGMRIREVSRLKVSNFKGHRIYFIGKGRKPREVYITEKTFSLLQKYIVEFKVNGFLWGRTLNNELPTEHTIRKRLQNTFLEAGFSGFYPHALRHSFATNSQINGASVAEIKEMMGHSSIATTERYLHGLNGRLEELFKKYS